MIGYAARTFILTTVFVSSAVAPAARANQVTPFDGRWSGRGIPESGVFTQSLRIEGH